MNCMLRVSAEDEAASKAHSTWRAHGGKKHIRGLLKEHSSTKLYSIAAGVVNRCQQDINNCRSMAEARQAEQEFFDSHEEYGEVSDHCGTAHLARGLNQILVDHIRGLLPSLRAKIEKEMDERAAELIGYGEAPVGDTSAAK